MQIRVRSVWFRFERWMCCFFCRKKSLSNFCKTSERMKLPISNEYLLQKTFNKRGCFFCSFCYNILQEMFTGKSF